MSLEANNRCRAHREQIPSMTHCGLGDTQSLLRDSSLKYKWGVTLATVGDRM